MMNAMKTCPTLLQQLVLLMTLVTAMPTHAIEEPTYTLIQTSDVFEVRQYAPYFVAEVVVPGPAADAGSRGFCLLGCYIFGKNKGGSKLEMTAPVTQTSIEPSAPVKLDMTAPVTQAAAPGGFFSAIRHAQGLHVSYSAGASGCKGQAE